RRGCVQTRQARGRADSPSPCEGTRRGSSHRRRPAERRESLSDLRSIGCSPVGSFSKQVSLPRQFAPGLLLSLPLVLAHFRYQLGNVVQDEWLIVILRLLVIQKYSFSRMNTKRSSSILGKLPRVLLESKNCVDLFG